MRPAIPVPSTAVPPAATPPGAPAVAALRPGQVVQARVVAAAPGGAVVLELGGRQLAARTEVPVAPGQQLAMKVQSTGPETVLQLLDARGGAAPGQLRLAATAGAPGPDAGPGPRLVPVSALRAAPGEVVSARVLGADGAGRLLLDVAGERISARAVDFARGTAPAPGQALALRVDAGGGALRPVADASAAAGAGGVGAAIALLRAALPRQQPLAEAMAALARAAQDPRLRAGRDGAAVRTAVDGLLASLPRAADAANPARLAAMVRDSGLFHEAREAAPGTAGSAAARSGGAGEAGGPDLKARLLAVARALGPAGGGAAGSGLESVGDAVRGALARIETLQVATAQGGPDGPVWHLELPLAHERGVDPLRLRIARERRGDGEGDGRRGGGAADTVWSAELLLEPAGGAALHARVSLTPAGVVAVLTTEDAGLHRALEEHSASLAALLEGARLEVASVRCRCAPLPALAPPAPPAPLVSERA